MKKMLLLTVLSVVVFLGCVERKDKSQSSAQFRRISVDEYLDKMKGGWVGQMAGVGWGGPTEFLWRGKIMPAEKMPTWTPGKINQFGQDDIYVEMTFIRTLQQYGFDVDIRQAGIDFANSGYGLAHANHYGRDNLRKGIAPPDSGHPKFTGHADDIDYQIEADYSGLIAPGMPNLVIELGEKFGRLMNYGDGVYGGQFVGGMYAEAFFEKDMDKIIRAGLDCVPEGSQFHECISDVIKWHSQNPDDWQKTWGLINDKYQLNPDYRKASCNKGDYNIDAKINAAYIVMGLLYGEGDIDKTIIISTRCGQDSDCNPSNAAGVLCTMIGFENLPDKFTSALNPNGKFSHSPYTFPKMIEVSAQLVRDAVKRQGGRIEKGSDGKEVFVIAVEAAKPSKLEQCWEPRPIASSKFTDAEMKKIKYTPAFPIEKIFHGVGKIFSGWRITACGKKMNPGLRDAFGGKKNVIVTHPVNRKTGAKVFRNIWVVPKNKKTTLTLVVGHHPKGDWDLIVRLKHGKELLRTPVSKDTAKDGWLKVEVDLSELAGKRARIELVNQSNGGEYEAGYWAKMDIVSEQSSAEFRRVSVDEYLDKMKAGWVGQMAGVGWGAPTEFRWKGAIIPAEKMPKWKPELINQFRQDDIYVEMTFIRTLEQYGFDVDIRQAGIDFANSGYNLWHANRYGRENLRKGIAPPDSSHPKFTDHADDIDYQIEADFSGLIAPGMPNLVIELGEKFGRLMNYGDGVYGGQFVGGMYAEAFFEKDMHKVVRAGLDCVPKGSQFHECISDVIKWHSENPNDWQKTWHLIGAKYHDNPDYRKASCDKGDFNIDAKINAAYIVMGLLYGEGDIDKTIIISTRCGQDSDCNPSNAGGILCTAIGFKNLPDKFTSALDPNGKFSHSPYTFPKMIEVSAQLVRDAVKRQGGRVEKDADGKEVFVIAVEAAKPSKLEQCWEPGPIASSKFTDAEMKKIKYIDAFPIGKFFPGWRIIDCGKKMNPGLRDVFGGKKNVLVTHPINRETGSKIFGSISIPKNKKTTLTLVVGHHPKGDWDLIVKPRKGKELFRTAVSKDTAKDGWLKVEVNLSELAGKRARIELINQSNGGEYEVAYWAKIDIVSE